MTEKPKRSAASRHRSTVGGHSYQKDARVEGFFEEIEHTADVAIRCGGPDLEALFSNAARGMYLLMGITPAPAGPVEAITVAMSAADVEGLLVDWLGELAYRAETDGLVPEQMVFKVLTRTRVEAELCGRRQHGFTRVIKAVTYHGLNIEKSPEGYTATVVFDV